MFPLNGGGRPNPVAPMMPQQNPVPAGGPAPSPQGAPQMGAPQSQAAQLLAAALQAIMREGMSPAVETALEGFFLMLQKLHQSASPAPGGAPQAQAQQMGFASLPNQAAQNAPVPGGRY